ncbi:MAG TPA: hypothetical protein VNL17_05730 [Verrucomicrobiae bacterium]|nr:hypothetical protein [Verrucomicrobiae bacterium]
METYLKVFAVVFFPFVFWKLLVALKTGVIHFKGYAKPFVRTENARDFWFTWSFTVFIFLMLLLGFSSLFR